MDEDFPQMLQRIFQGKMLKGIAEAEDPNCSDSATTFEIRLVLTTFIGGG
jgi:hypothetical protein